MENLRRLFFIAAIACMAAPTLAYSQTIPQAPTNLLVDGGGTGGPCSAAANTPGGSDGRGGCFPGPGNVGIPAGTQLTTYTGPCIITVANTVIDAKDVQCSGGLEIRANNVTISRSRIRDSVHGQEATGVAFTITDSLLDGAQVNNGGYACVNCGVDGWNTTVIRTEIIHTNRGVFCMRGCTVRDSWIHGTNLDTRPCPQPPYNTCPHASAVRVEQNANLIHNTLDCSFTGPFNDDLGCSAAISGYPDFAPIHDNTIDGNLIVSNNIGVGFCAYGGGTANKPFSTDPLNATNIVFQNNVFQRGANGKCGTYGAVTDFVSGRTGNVWLNNRWDNGTAVLPQ
jgi:hypothetical protein